MLRSGACLKVPGVSKVSLQSSPGKTQEVTPISAPDVYQCFPTFLDGIFYSKNDVTLKDIQIVEVCGDGVIRNVDTKFTQLNLANGDAAFYVSMKLVDLKNKEEQDKFVKDILFCEGPDNYKQPELSHGGTAGFYLQVKLSDGSEHPIGCEAVLNCTINLAGKLGNSNALNEQFQQLLKSKGKEGVKLIKDYLLPEDLMARGYTVNVSLP